MMKATRGSRMKATRGPGMKATMLSSMNAPRGSRTKGARYYLLLVAALSVMLVGSALVGGGCGSSESSASTETTAASPAATETVAPESPTPEPAGSAVRYTPGGDQFAQVWKDFYAAQDEADIMTPLITAGTPMVPAICEAVEHVNMDRRRYAIGSLGFIGDTQAIPTLTGIMTDTAQEDYFRADALQALYQIDKSAAKAYAEQNKGATGTFGQYVKAVLNDESWLTEKPSEGD